MLRYNANGTLDTSFGNGGSVSNGSFSTASAGALYPVTGTANDGKIVVAGQHTGGGFVLARYNANGSLDTAFGSGGLVTTQIGASGAFAVTIQADGRIVAAGWTRPTGSSQNTFAVARYNADGSLDSTFGSGGIVTTLIGVKSNGLGVALQPNGDIVVAGMSSNGSKWNFAVARYLPSAPQIGSFTASSNPVTAGSSVTLTASNISDGNPNSTVTQVAFYYFDSSGNKVTLGYGTQSSSGAWIYTFSTAGWTPGTYTLFAQAEDSDGVFGDPVALSLRVL
jgi:uncharacterized delta-60 repeat protein